MSRLPARRAAALSYRPGDDAAPRVTASGRGRVAERIAETARAAGVPVREDPALAEVLAGLDPGAEIPPETYRAVAEILAFLYRVDRDLGDTRGTTGGHNDSNPAARGPNDRP